MLTLRTVNRKVGKRWIVDSNIDGKRVRRFFTSKSAGQTYLAELRLQQREAGQAWMTLEPEEQTELLLLFREAGELGLSLSRIRESLPKLAGNGSCSVTVAKAVAECLASKQTAGRRQKYVTKLGALLRNFAKGREQQPLSTVTPNDVEAWISKAKTAGSRATYLSRIQTLFSFGIRRGWVEFNPCQRIDRVSQERKPPAILTNEQVRAALAFTRQEYMRFLAWLALAVFAGVRPEELDQVTWADVKWDSRTLVIDAAASKVRRRRIVHLEQTALDWLKLAKKLKADLPVPCVSRRRWLRAMRDHLGFKAWPQDVLRHTAASQLLARRKDAAAVALELGNSPQVLLTHYRELVTREQAAEFWAISPSG
ncbi:MAG: tyrosine-type recombinase/integrase [Verrucomicrobiales bacterium]|nr:tyrosine-type recombinase/integrase [Verrucomicrobiales bacterium]